MTLWLFGDSIFDGAITDGGLVPGDALWPIRAPAETMDLMLGRPIARRGGATLLPHGLPKATARLAAMVGREIRPEDVVVLLDVGLHCGDPDRHERQWLELRAATAAHAGTVLVCEGFDNGALGRTDLQHRAPIGGRSPNDAVVAAAAAEIPHAGQTRLVLTAKPLLRFHHFAEARFGVGAFRSDGVHLNPWGQARLCWLLLEAAGLADRAATSRWKGFAARHWRNLGAADRMAAARLAASACVPGDTAYPAGGGAGPRSGGQLQGSASP